MFFKQLLNICEQKGLKLTPFIKSLGLSESAIARWRSGSIPNGDVLCKIADKLGVSVDFLLGRTNVRETGIKNAAPQIVKRTVYSYEGEDGLGTEEQIFDKSKAKPLNELIKSAKTLSHEQINLLTAMAKNMKDNS